jgi:hypothetical protein
MFSDFTPVACDKVVTVDEGKAGGFTLELKNRRMFHVMDDEAAKKLNERVSPELDRFEQLSLQSVEDAKQIARSLQYVLVFEAKLFGVPIYKFEALDVPAYAMDAYEKASEQNKVIIKDFTTFIEDNVEFKREAMGKYIAIVNGKVMTSFFGSAAQIFDNVPEDARVKFFRVTDDLAVERATR